jgi:hypothetical protein
MSCVAGSATSARRSPRCIAFATPVLLLLVWCAPAQADFDSRECIVQSDSSGLWEVPGNSEYDVATLKFNNLTASNLVVHAVGMFYGSTAGTSLIYTIVLDGVSYGGFKHVVSAIFPDKHIVRAFIPAVAAGLHTLTVHVKNQSSSPVSYFLMWISPLLVESSETQASRSTSGRSTSGTGWTQLAAIVMSSPAGKMVYLGGYVEVNSGTSGNELEYEYLRNGVVLAHYTDVTPTTFPDSHQAAIIDPTPDPTSNTYSIQVRSTTGSATTFGTATLQTETVPQVTVFDGTAQNVTIPSDNTFHTIASSGYLPLMSSSEGAYGTKGHGFAYATAHESYAAAGFLELLLNLRDPILNFEVGVLYSPGSNGAFNLEPDISDWETLGLQTGSYNKIDLIAAGNCTSSSPRTFPESRFQVMAVPDNMGITADNNCHTNFNNCCSQHPSCIAYQCTFNSAIPRNTHASVNACLPVVPEPTTFNFYTLPPCRVLDTRNPPNSALPFNAPTQVAVAGTCGIPTTAKSVTFNVTTVLPSSDVNVQIYPGNQPPPPGTNVNSTRAGHVRAAMGLLTLATNGTGTVTVLPTASVAGSTNLILDATGYFQ